MKRHALTKWIMLISAAPLLAACGAVREMSKADVDQADYINSMIDKAREMDAATCAPEELADAEAYLALANHEALEFHSRKEITDYFQEAEVAAEDLLNTTTPCWQARRRDSADQDNDGVADYLDKCPNTPEAAEIDARGCPIDSDNDKVSDYMDACEDTPQGVSVDARGCPLDADADEVADYLDQCPSTPAGASVDSRGCPTDMDGDDVADYLDQCPATPSEVEVDAKGCPLDNDNDGIANYLDSCANTPIGAVVDVSGCPIDSDGDAVSDWDEENKYQTDPMKPDTDGDALSDGDELFFYNTNPLKADTDGGGMNDGLEVGFALTDPLNPDDDVKEVSRAELNINFDINSDEIKPQYESDIAKVADFMKQFPEVSIKIEGYTDAVGDPDYNLFLSQKRADNVVDKLVNRYGINPERLSAEAFGESKPIAPNDTREGRAQNRRIYAVGTTLGIGE